MSLFSKIGEKIGEKILGTVVTDFGTVPISKHGWNVAITLRKKGAGDYHLVFGWHYAGSTTWESLEASPETLDKLESIVLESRRQIEKAAA